MLKFIYVITIALSLSVTSACAQEVYQEGKQYAALDIAQPVETGDKIEVREFFWYGCPHCFKLEDELNSWLARLPEDVMFVRMPAVFNKVWKQHAKFYYTLEAMGELDDMHGKVFDAIHIDKKELIKDEAFIDFAVDLGLDKSTIEETLQSFAVSSKLGAAKTSMPKYNITGVPAFVVAGKYLTDVGSAGGVQSMFEVIEFLINKAKTEI